MDQRKCEIFENGAWRVIEFKLLLKGDKFRLTDPLGKGFEHGDRELISGCDAYLNSSGIWAVKTT